MNSILRGIGALLLGLAAAQVRAELAPSPRAQLKEAIEQLQKTPDDAALREKIIKLSKKVKPTPAVPEEARRFLARGNAAFESAKTDEDYKLALPEFRNAVNKAPWWADGYYNLAKTQEKTGDVDGALVNYRLCLAADPAGKDAESVRTLTYKLEFKAEQKAKEGAAKSERRDWATNIVSRLQQTYGGFHAVQLHQCLALSRGKTICDDQEADGNNWHVSPAPEPPAFSVDGENSDQIVITIGTFKFCGVVNGSAFESVNWTYCGSDVNDLRKGSAAKMSLEPWSGHPGILMQYLFSGRGCKRDWYEFAQ